MLALRGAAHHGVSGTLALRGAARASVQNPSFALIVLRCYARVHMLPSWVFVPWVYMLAPDCCARKTGDHHA
jgi:hypothetical protein